VQQTIIIFTHKQTFICLLAEWFSALKAVFVGEAEYVTSFCDKFIHNYICKNFITIYQVFQKTLQKSVCFVVHSVVYIFYSFFRYRLRNLYRMMMNTINLALHCVS